MVKKITAREAEKELKRQGLDFGMDGVTFYAINIDTKEVYSFDTKKERDEWVARH